MSFINMQNKIATNIVDLRSIVDARCRSCKVLLGHLHNMDYGCVESIDGRYKGSMRSESIILDGEDRPLMLAAFISTIPAPS